MVNKHALSVASYDAHRARMFRAECTCGWVSSWRTVETVCLNNAGRHLDRIERGAVR